MPASCRERKGTFWFPTPFSFATWITGQAESFARHAESTGEPTALLFRDRDAKFVESFDVALKAKGIQVRRNQPQSPNLNAFVERWIQSIQQECLNHFIVFGESHFNYLVNEYVEHYHNERPHQGKDNAPLMQTKPPDENVPTIDGLDCHERLGGLLKSFSRKVA